AGARRLHRSKVITGAHFSAGGPMDTTQISSTPKKKELIDALTTARDSVRVQLHLLSLEARERWQELESKLEALQAKLEREGERVSETATRKVRDLTRSVSQFVR